MDTITKKESFVKQISLYLKNSDYQSAYSLSKEFIVLFPKELISHFLFSKSAFFLQKYEEALAESRKAFNLASDNDSLIACAILSASAYYELKDYQKGFEFLKSLEKTVSNEQIESLLFVFSLALKNDAEALLHVDLLYKLNKKAGEELIIRHLN